MNPDRKTFLTHLARALMSSETAEIRREILGRDGCRCRFCGAEGGGSVLRDGRWSRVVLDLAYLDDNPGNLGRRHRRPNVVLACQRCSIARGMAAIERAKLEAAAAAIEAQFGPELPLFG